jgi:glycosyltransferase involved in cell wall biosynthesis
MIEAMNKIHSELSKYELLQYGIDEIESKPKEKIIFSNRLHEPFYRIDRIIDYFEQVSEKYPEWELIIGANGSETENLKAIVASRSLSDRVKFVGWLQKESNNNWYARATIYVSIPESDGTSVSLLEAMSVGCIPVVPDLRVSHEWIKDGYNGVIEKQGLNPLEEAMKIDQSVCSAYNKDLIMKSASRELCTKRFIELYEEAKK